MIISINYADENFIEAQKHNTRTAYKNGKVDKVIEYSPKDIDIKFYKENKKILSQKRGGGYWLWKPYIILKTLYAANNGDYIFYCDSGAVYVNDLNYLIRDMENANQSIMGFELPLIEKQWTKIETFKLLNCFEDKYFNSNQILATFILIKKDNYSIKFFEQYLNYCSDENVLTDKLDTASQLDEFCDHRHDQSIFSLLYKKAGLEPFRDPSQYGDYPWEYADINRLIRYKNYKNSSYPRILISQRKEKFFKFILKVYIKDILFKLNLIKYRGE